MGILIHIPIPSVVDDYGLALAVANIALVDVVDVPVEPVVFLIGHIVTPIPMPIIDAIDARHNGHATSTDMEHSSLGKQIGIALTLGAGIDFGLGGVITRAASAIIVRPTLFGHKVKLDDIIRAQDGDAGHAVSIVKLDAVGRIVLADGVLEISEGRARGEQADEDGGELSGADFVIVLHLDNPFHLVHLDYTAKGFGCQEVFAILPGEILRRHEIKCRPS